MKIKAIRKFRDKKTNKVYQAGEELEVNQTRFREINSTKWGKLAEEVKEVKKKEVKKKETEPKEEK